ncbi:tRNA 2-thiouridine(34) synthase MnmA, partial [Rhizobium sp. KAs_5_22]
IIYVAKASDESFLLSKSCEVNEINFTLDISKYVDDVNDFECSAKFRYRQKDQKVFLKKVYYKTYQVIFDNQVKAVTEGQEAVFYLNEICI